MSELVRANKVTVKMVDEKYVAEFSRTHKKIATVEEGSTEWVRPENTTKTGERESFRLYVIEHATEYGVEWNPSDLRAPSNVRYPKYETDDLLIEDAVNMVHDQFKEMVEKCKHKLEWINIDVDEIIPMQKTSKGTPLTGLGIEDGKYKNGNWAWADIKSTLTLSYKDEEIYVQIPMELVSGQLKKPKLTITKFNELIDAELINNNLITEEELNPSKKDESKVIEDDVPVIEEPVTDDTPVVEEPVVETPVVEEPVEKPKRKYTRRVKKEEVK